MRGDYWPGYDDKQELVGDGEPDWVGGTASSPDATRYLPVGVPSARQAAAMGELIRETNARRARERSLKISLAAVSLQNETLAL